MARELSNLKNKQMKKIAKILIGFTLTLFALAMTVPSKATASCPNAYDVTYPSKFCDPQGFGSCTRQCPGNP